VPRISVSDAKAALDSGQAILVDVRSADAYASGHAAGAVSIPLENFENNIGSLSLEKSQWIITYCT
jgi:rhodanese-related sulfurtransferase